jgi:hypothetical protein
MKNATPAATIRRIGLAARKFNKAHGRTPHEFDGYVALRDALKREPTAQEQEDLYCWVAMGVEPVH